MRWLILITSIVFSISLLNVDSISQVREKFKGEYKGKEKKEEAKTEEKKTEQPSTIKIEITGNVIFLDDFAEYGEGDIPSKWEIEKGSGEVVTYRGRRWLKIFSSDFVAKPLIKLLPQNYRIEFDVILGGYYNAVKLTFLTARGEEPYWIFFDHITAKSERGASTSISLDVKSINKVTLEVKNNSLRCLINGKTVLYEARVFDKPANAIRLKVEYASADSPTYISNFAVYNLTK
ncbi:MAG: hypothetical protein ABDI07_06055 [Candidatus Kryptonium sp.]